MNIKEFLNTAFGSWLKVFIAAALTQYVIELTQGTAGLFTWDRAMLEKLATAGALALLPIIINWLNPNDPRYGKKDS